jgi:glycerol-3-phosphate dehydrogenase
MYMDSMLDCDLLVIGGGLNGTAIARDAAGRGLSVILCEQDDLACGASALGPALIHGLTPGSQAIDFPALRIALTERDILMRCAPHISKTARIVMPQTGAERSGWKMRTALRLQNLLAGRDLLPAAREIDLLHHVAGGALRPEYSHGWIYSDGWIDAARLTVLNALDAAEGGAKILTRTACREIQRSQEGWHASLRGSRGISTGIRTRALVNAAGGGADDFLQAALGKRLSARALHLTQILVRRALSHDYAYLLHAADGRQVHVMPQEPGYTLISALGSEEAEADVEADSALLCETVNRYFTARIAPQDIVWSRSTVWLSPLDRQARARQVHADYSLEMDSEEAPLLSVIGGSIGSARQLAEEAVNCIASRLGCHGGAWTADACLPGGDLYGLAPSSRSIVEFSNFVQAAKQQYSWAPAALIARWARCYGSRIHKLLADCRDAKDLGAQPLPGLYEAELRYLMQAEWAQTAADILWRRTRLGLALPKEAEAALDGWIAESTAQEFAAAV